MIEQSLFLFLKADSDLSGLISSGQRTRIYPLVIPQKRAEEESQYPCLVYAVTGDNRTKSYCGTDGVVQIIVSIDSYASTMKAARNLSNVLRSAILDYRGLMGEVVVRDVTLVSSLALSDMEPGVLRVSDTFSIWCEQE